MAKNKKSKSPQVKYKEAPFVKELKEVKAKVEELNVDIPSALHALKNLGDPTAKGNICTAVGLCTLVAFHFTALPIAVEVLNEFKFSPIPDSEEPENDLD